jgi:hypothetical protein
VQKAMRVLFVRTAVYAAGAIPATFNADNHAGRENRGSENKPSDALTSERAGGKYLINH